MTLQHDTARLRLRHLDHQDYADLMQVYGDPEAMRWVDDGEPITPEDCRRWIDVTLRNYQVRGYGMSALEHRESGQVVGFCGVVHPGQQEVPEIKYALKRNYWGLGLATEAVRGMLDYFYRQFPAPRVIATVDPDNLASRRVLEKAGLALRETILDEAGRPTLVYESFKPSLRPE